MSPAPVPSHDDVEGAFTVLEFIKSAWGYLASAIIGGGVLVGIGVKKREFREVQEDVAEWKRDKHLYALKTDLESKQTVCMASIKDLIRQENKAERIEMRAELREMREDQATMNANIMKLMARMDVDPVEPRKRRRQEDWEG